MFKSLTLMKWTRIVDENQPTVCFNLFILGAEQGASLSWFQLVLIIAFYECALYFVSLLAVDLHSEGQQLR